MHNKYHLKFKEFSEDHVTPILNTRKIIEAAVTVGRVINHIKNYCTDYNVEEMFELIQQNETLRAFDIVEVALFNDHYGVGLLEEFKRGFSIDPKEHDFEVCYEFVTNKPPEKYHFSINVLDEE